MTACACGADRLVGIEGQCSYLHRSGLPAYTKAMIRPAGTTNRTYLEVCTRDRPIRPLVHLDMIRWLLGTCSDAPETKPIPTPQESQRWMEHSIVVHDTSALAHWLCITPDAVQSMSAAGFGLLDVYLVAAPSRIAASHSTRCLWWSMAKKARANQLDHFRAQFGNWCTYWEQLDQSSFLPMLFPWGFRTLYTEGPLRDDQRREEVDEEQSAKHEYFSHLWADAQNWEDVIRGMMMDDSQSDQMDDIRLQLAIPEQRPELSRCNRAVMDETIEYKTLRLLTSRSDHDIRSRDQVCDTTFRVVNRLSKPSRHLACLLTSAWIVEDWEPISDPALPVAVPRAFSWLTPTGGRFWIRNRELLDAHVQDESWSSMDFRTTWTSLAPLHTLSNEERTRAMDAIVDNSPTFRDPAVLRGLLFGHAPEVAVNGLHEMAIHRSMEDIETQHHWLLCCAHGHVSTWTTSPTQLIGPLSAFLATANVSCSTCERDRIVIRLQNVVCMGKTWLVVLAEESAPPLFMTSSLPRVNPRHSNVFLDLNQFTFVKLLALLRRNRELYDTVTTTPTTTTTTTTTTPAVPMETSMVLPAAAYTPHWAEDLVQTLLDNKNSIPWSILTPMALRWTMSLPIQWSWDTGFVIHHDETRLMPVTDQESAYKTILYFLWSDLGRRLSFLFRHAVLPARSDVLLHSSSVHKGNVSTPTAATTTTTTATATHAGIGQLDIFQRITVRCEVHRQTIQLLFRAARLHVAMSKAIHLSFDPTTYSMPHPHTMYYATLDLIAFLLPQWPTLGHAMWFESQQQSSRDENEAIHGSFSSLVRYSHTLLHSTRSVATLQYTSLTVDPTLHLVGMARWFWFAHWIQASHHPLFVPPVETTTSPDLPHVVPPVETTTWTASHMARSVTTTASATPHVSADAPRTTHARPFFYAWATETSSASSWKLASSPLARLGWAPRSLCDREVSLLVPRLQPEWICQMTQGMTKPRIALPDMHPAQWADKWQRELTVLQERFPTADRDAWTCWIQTLQQPCLIRMHRGQWFTVDAPECMSLWPDRGLTKDMLEFHCALLALVVQMGLADLRWENRRSSGGSGGGGRSMMTTTMGATGSIVLPKHLCPCVAAIHLYVFTSLGFPMIWFDMALHGLVRARETATATATAMAMPMAMAVWYDPWEWLQDDYKNSQGGSSWMSLVRHAKNRDSARVSRVLFQTILAFLRAVEAVVNGTTMIVSCPEWFRIECMSDPYAQRYWNMLMRMWFWCMDWACPVWPPTTQAFVTFRVHPTAPRMFWIDLKSELHMRLSALRHALDVSDFEVEKRDLGLEILLDAPSTTTDAIRVIKDVAVHTQFRLDLWRHGTTDKMKRLVTTNRHWSMGMGWIPRVASSLVVADHNEEERKWHSRMFKHWERNVDVMFKMNRTATEIRWDPTFCSLSTVQNIMRTEGSATLPHVAYHTDIRPVTWAAVTHLTLPQDPSSQQGTLIVVADRTENMWDKWFTSLAGYMTIEGRRPLTCVWIDTVWPAESICNLKTSSNTSPSFVIHSSFDQNSERGDVAWNTVMVDKVSYERLHRSRGGSGATSGSGGGHSRVTSVSKHGEIDDPSMADQLLSTTSNRPHFVLMNLRTLQALWKHPLGIHWIDRIWYRVWDRIIVTHPVVTHLNCFHILHANMTWVLSTSSSSSLPSPPPPPPPWSTVTVANEHPSLPLTALPNTVPDPVRLASLWCTECVADHLFKNTEDVILNRSTHPLALMTFMLWHVLVLRCGFLHHWSPPFVRHQPNEHPSVTYWRNILVWAQYARSTCGLSRSETCNWFFSEWMYATFGTDATPSDRSDKMAKSLLKQWPCFREDGCFTHSHDKSLLHTQFEINKPNPSPSPLKLYEPTDTADLLRDDVEHPAFLERGVERKINPEWLTCRTPWVLRTPRIRDMFLSWTNDKMWFLLSPAAHGQWIHDSNLLSYLFGRCRSNRRTLGSPRILLSCVATHEARAQSSQFVSLFQSGEIKTTTTVLRTGGSNDDNKIMTTTAAGTGAAVTAMFPDSMTRNESSTRPQLTWDQVCKRLAELKPSGPEGRNTQVLLYNFTTMDFDKMRMKRVHELQDRLDSKTTGGKGSGRGKRKSSTTAAAPLGRRPTALLDPMVSHVRNEEKKAKKNWASFEMMRQTHWMWAIEEEPVVKEALRACFADWLGSDLAFTMYDLKCNGVWIIQDLMDDHALVAAWESRIRSWRDESFCEVHPSNRVAWYRPFRGESLPLTDEWPEPFVLWTRAWDTTDDDDSNHLRWMPTGDVLNLVVLSTDKWSPERLQQYVFRQTKWSYLPHLNVSFPKK